jgi:hypothetical protein
VAAALGAGVVLGGGVGGLQADAAAAATEGGGAGGAGHGGGQCGCAAAVAAAGLGVAGAWAWQRWQQPQGREWWVGGWWQLWGSTVGGGGALISQKSRQLKQEVVSAVHSAEGKVSSATHSVVSEAKHVGELASESTAVRRPLRPFWRPLWLRFTYVTSVLVTKY